ncbi:MAG TPA: hypothetical protein VN600_04350 [Gemmatimonadaceae bacterium]|nr:hypothetical protein [Gemmatimonadaceae bacterium]
MTIFRRIAHANRLGFFRLLATSAAALVPALATAHAQRSIPGLGRSGLGGHESEIALPKQVNPVNLLIEHRQELALSDTQFARIVVIKRALDSTDLPLLRKMDSVQRLFRKAPLFSDPSPARRDSIAEGRALVREASAALRENIGDARARAFNLLGSRQLPKAEQLTATAQQALDDEESRGGRGRGGRAPSSFERR